MDRWHWKNTRESQVEKVMIVRVDDERGAAAKERSTSKTCRTARVSAGAYNRMYASEITHRDTRVR